VLPEERGRGAARASSASWRGSRRRRGCLAGLEWAGLDAMLRASFYQKLGAKPQKRMDLTEAPMAHHPTSRA